MMDDLEEIIQYYKDGNSLAATKRAYPHYSKDYIKTIIQRAGVHIRTQSEQCVIENQRRGYKLNHNYFDTLTLKNSYWLGFLAADGTVRKDCNAIKVGLKAEDKDILIQLKQDLQSEAPIKEYKTNNGFNVVEFSFSSKQIKQKLGEYSIVPNKTYIGITMQNIPDDYKISFIKGFYDGDGTYTSGKVKITSHLDGILKEIQDFIPQKSYIYHSIDRNIYSLEMSTLPSLDFLKMIYELNTPKLQRKYDKYFEAINSRIQ